MRALRAFTLTELLIVIAVVGLLVVCLFAALPSLRAASEGSQCIARLRAISQATLAYTRENHGIFPTSTNTELSTQGIWFDYRDLVSPYLDLAESRESTLFVCPASGTNTSTTYLFNGGNVYHPSFKGLAGKSLSGLSQPGRILLIVEHPVLLARSYHVRSSLPPHTDSQSYVAFVDGHVALQKFFWRGAALNVGINPPPSYDYLWGD